MAEKDCHATRVTGPGRRLPPCPPPPPRVARGDRAQPLPRIDAPRCLAGDRACAPASVSATGRRLLTPSTGAVTRAPSRGSRSHLPAHEPCRPPCPPRTGALRGGVTAPPVGVSPRQRAAAAAVAAAPPLSPPHAPPATAAFCTCAHACSRPWSRPACPVSIRRRARHSPEGQGIARTCLELNYT